MASLPTGTVTFLFTDIEGSTLLLRRLGTDYVDVLALHRRLLRAAFKDGGGQEISNHAMNSSSHSPTHETPWQPP